MESGAAESRSNGLSNQPMTFEQQLTRAFETLSERLRGEIHEHVQRASAELIAAAPYDRDPAVVEAARQELEFAVAAARRETRDATWQEAHEQGIAAGKNVGRDEAQLEAVDVAPTGDDLEWLAGAMRDVDAAQSLTETLDALVTAASQQTTGAHLWLVRGSVLHRWEPTGAEPGQTPPVRAMDARGPIAQAVASNATARDEHVMAVPIALAGQVVAIFSAERENSGEHFRPRTDYLELLVRYTAKSLEALTAFKTARALTQHPEQAATTASRAAVDAPSEEDTSARRY